jgi:hypothetical protein
VEQGRERGAEKGGATTRDRQKGVFDPLNAEAVELGRAKGGELGRAKGRAAGKGVKRPRMSAADKALLPQGLCSGGCGKHGEAQRAVQGAGQG